MKNNYKSGYRGFGQGSDSQDFHLGFEYCKTCKELPIGRRFPMNLHNNDTCYVYEFPAWVERPTKKQLKNNNQMKNFEDKFCNCRFLR
jgi:hypothetical protein